MQSALTYDDVLLAPGPSDLSSNDAELSTLFSRNIPLSVPLVSAARCDVTESKLAIAIAEMGGLGIIHRGLTVERQSHEVQRVKRHQASIVTDPLTVDPATTIERVKKMVAASGISGFPVVETGGLLVGVVTNRDLQFAPYSSHLVRDVMTPLERLITVRRGESLSKARELMHQSRLERILVVDSAFELCGIVTAKDINQSIAYPDRCRDAEGRLRVAAAAGTSAGERHRIRSLIEAGADVVVIEATHAHSHAAQDQVRWMKRSYPYIDVVVGNVVTGEAALALADCGADGIKVGMGSGEPNHLQSSAGFGIPLLSAIFDVEDALEGTHIPIIADGAIAHSRDAVKAIAAGASSIVLDTLLAGTSEAPGEEFLDDGRLYKRLARDPQRTFASNDMQGRNSTDFETYDFESGRCQEARANYRGPLALTVDQLTAGIRRGMMFCGTRSVADLQREANFVRLSAAAISGSRMRDVGAI
ncbi:IMP dehydrogenase [Caballeronia sp. LZ043]|uniref:IMP dehydrogenase n=1 Tax=Caballeronia sp. LZ043 TaxID=3038569 RepID=UPI00285E872E|nr:IMP dehydrogenase [Caballeronia sp. LZ043]MDR5826219.1 IMP dehydrogenase [Caballeronia sp. LZ043]